MGINDPTLPARLAKMHEIAAETGRRIVQEEKNELKDRIVKLTLAIAGARNTFLDLEERLRPDVGEHCDCRLPEYTCPHCSAQEAADALQKVLDGK